MRWQVTCDMFTSNKAFQRKKFISFIQTVKCFFFNQLIEGFPAKRAYIAFLADFHFLQDQANFWQTDLF